MRHLQHCGIRQAVQLLPLASLAFLRQKRLLLQTSPNNVCHPLLARCSSAFLQLPTHCNFTFQSAGASTLIAGRLQSLSEEDCCLLSDMYSLFSRRRTSLWIGWAARPG